jgi:hypothetical protein
LSFFSPFPVRPKKEWLYWKNIHPFTDPAATVPGVTWTNGQTRILLLRLIMIPQVAIIIRAHEAIIEWDMWVMM